MTKKKEVKPVPVQPEDLKPNEHFSFCQACEGKGFDLENRDQLCEVCQGSGTVKA